MSRFSGKCDFYDTIVMSNYSLEDFTSGRVKIYVNEERVKINFLTDLIQYYPYIIAIGCFNTKDKSAVVELSSIPHTDRREKETLDFYTKNLLRIYNRCKRKKTAFDIEKAVNEIAPYERNETKNTIKRLAERIKTDGKKASTDGLHFEIYDWYRRELVEEMLSNGIDPAKYGYERFLNK